MRTSSSKKAGLIAVGLVLATAGVVGYASIHADQPAWESFSGFQDSLTGMLGLSSVDGVEDAWAGGGQAVLFEDDMTRTTAGHYEAAPHPDGEYYGGAVPTRADGAERWEHEDHRWGTEVLRGDRAEPWAIRHEGFEGLGTNGVWKFGKGTSVAEATYPDSVVAAVVTPTIDLTGVTKVEQQHLEGDTGIPYLPETEDIPADSTYQDLTEAGHFKVSEDPHERTMGLATAALELHHAYEFDDLDQSGARVEISVHDPLHGWTGWEGLEPTNQRLVLAEDGAELRAELPMPSGTQIEPFAEDPEDVVRFEMEETPWTVEAGGSSPSSVSGDPLHPGLYRGLVAASSAAPGGPWEGFVSDSAGPEEVASVFDLSRFAGHEIKLRFVVASTGIVGEDRDHHGLGWLLDHVKVHAVGDEDIEVLDMPYPGDGAVVNRTVKPVVALRNTGSEARLVDVSWTVDGEEALTESVNIGTGPTAKAFLRSPLETRGGLSNIEVQVTDAELPGATDTEQTTLAMDGFHVLQGPGGALDVVEVRVTPIKEGEPVDHPGRFLMRGQSAIVQVDVENLGSEPAVPTMEGEDADLQPVIVDRRGQPVGAFEPMAESTGTVLPASRSTSGALGEEDPVRTLNWTWTGFEQAAALDLSVVDGGGELLFGAGHVLVEDVPAVPMDLDFRNPEGFSGGCGRLERFADRAGVAGCVGDGAIQMPVVPVTSGRLNMGGPHVDVTLTHQGGPLTVSAWFQETPGPPEGTPPSVEAGEGWMLLGNATFDGRETWSLTTNPILSPGEDDRSDVGDRTGWLQVNLSAGSASEPIHVAEVILDLIPEGDEEDARGFELLQRTFQGTVAPHRTVLRNLQGGELVHLTGVDEWVEHADVTTGLPVQEEIGFEDFENVPNVARIVVNESVEVFVVESGGDPVFRGEGTTYEVFMEGDPDLRIASQGGDLKLETGRPGSSSFSPPTPPMSVQVPSGRLAEDSILRLPGEEGADGTYNLDGVQPTLSLSHWYGLGPGGMAVVEVRPTDDEGTTVPWERAENRLDQTPSARHHLPPSADGWHPVAVFEGETRGDALRPVEVALDPFVGEEVEIQLRYHLDPSLDLASIPSGWAIGNLVLRMQADEGPVTLLDTANAGHDQLKETDNEGRIQGGHVVGSVDATRTDRGNFPWPKMNPPRIDEEVGGYEGSVSRTYGFRPEQRPFEDPVQVDKHERAWSLISDSIDLRASQSPTLTIDQQGVFTVGSWWHSDTIVCEAPMVGLEYRVLDRDGFWAESWTPAVEHDPSDLSVTHVNLPDPLGEPPGPPFNNTIPFRDLTDQDPESGQTDGPVVFSLEPLVGEIVQFRLTMWLQHPTDAPTGTCSSTYPPTNFFWIARATWLLDGIRIGEQREVVDTAIEEVRFLTDDHASVRQAGGHEHLGDDEEVVFADDEVFVSVNVTNRGIIPVDAEVGLTVTKDEGDVPLSVQAVESGRSLQALEGFEPGATEEVLFRIVAGDDETHLPGEYTASATVEPTDAIDRVPENAEALVDVRLLPVRNLHVDPVVSGVSPPIAGDEDERTVTVHLVNIGNVDESNVTVSGHLVAFDGLDTVDRSEDLNLTEKQAATAPLPLPKRGDGSTELSWSFDEAAMTQAGLEAGSEYAFKIIVEPAEDSFNPWWAEDEAQEAALVNLTDTDPILLRFITEEELYRTDLSPEGSGDKVSAVEGAYPANVDPKEAWTAKTLVDGHPIEEHDEVPTWELMDPIEIDLGFDGLPTGQAWFLDAYDGFEAATHILETPPLPAHVVAGTSNAILDLTYASDVTEGQAIIETRTHTQGEWSPWRPIAEEARDRVAIVVPPDFPQVTGSAFEGVTSHATFEADEDEGEEEDFPWPGPGDGGHPRPPFYEDPGNHPDITPNDPSEEFPASCGEDPGDCAWTPFPRGASTYDQEWVDALNQTLVHLAEAIGQENVGLFTMKPSGDLPTDFRLNDVTQESDALPRYEHTEGDEEYVFPIEDLSALGERLGSYGSLLVVGDNTTKTLADRAGSLGEMTFYNGSLEDALANAEHGTFIGPEAHAGDEAGLEYHRVLFTLLEHAPGQGVSTVGALGPSVTTLAQSGQFAGTTMSAPPPVSPLQEPEDMFGPGPDTFLRCTANGQGGATQPDEPQPRPACYRPGSERLDPLVHDTPQNYEYYPPHVAQNAAIRDLVQRGRAEIGSAGVEVDSAPAGVAVVTASRSQSADDWVQAVLDNRAPVTGILSEGDWRTLPATFTSPIGGVFERNATGDEVFDGRPTQMRIVVESNLAERGHGAFAVDRLDVFGTPRDQAALGVEIAHPNEDEVYHPNDPFEVEVELVNRGTQRLLEVGELVDVEVTAESELCQLPSPSYDIELETLLDPGDKTTVVVEDVFGGRMPSCSDVDPREQDIEVTVTATVDEDVRDENVGFEDTVTFEVRQVDQVTIDSLSITPTLVEDLDEEITIEALLTNEGNRATQPRGILTFEHARPWLCADHDKVAGCIYQGDEPIHVEAPIQQRALAALDEIPLLRSGATDKLTTTIDTTPIPPGVYRLTLQIETRPPGIGTVHTETVEQRVFLIDEDLALDAYRPYYDVDFGLDDILPQATNVQISHPHLQGQHAGDGGGAASDHGQFHTHTGLYAPDPETRFNDPQTGDEIPLKHGWRACPDCSDEALEWRRAPLPSWPPGERERVWQQQGSAAGRPAVWELGHADFGPDGVEMPILSVNDPGQAMPGPYPTLASLDDPTLIVEARGQATEYTGFVVQMRLPQLGGCDRPHPNQTHCEAYWDWSTPWFTLYGDQTEPLPDPVDQRDSQPGSTTRARGTPAESTTYWLDRRAPSNPLAGGTGISSSPFGQSGTQLHPAPHHVGFPDPNPEFEHRWGTPRCFPGQSSIFVNWAYLRPGSRHEGLWGGQTPDVFDTSWQTLTFDVSPDAQGNLTSSQRSSGNGCTEAAWPGEIPENRLEAYCEKISKRHPSDSGPGAESGTTRDLCRYAPFPEEPGRGHGWADQEDGHPFQKIEGQEELTEVARPIQFRVLAASFGGDEGASFVEIRDIALTDHDLTFVGPEVIELQDLTDAQHEELPGEPEIFPVRVENTGPIEDRIVVSWRPEGDATSLRGAQVDFAHSPEFQEALEELEVHLQAGEGAIVWVRIQTEIPFGVEPGVLVPIPFLVEAHSRNGPAVRDDILVDAAYERRAWGDLDLRTLALDDSTDRLEPFAAAEGQRVDVTVVFRNEGQHAVGSAGDVVPVQLVVERLDPENGTVLDTGVVDEVQLEGPIQPFDQVGEQTFVEMEWVPDEQGVFSVRAVVNADTGERARLAEASYHNNELTRPVTVGPFELADLQITDAWLVPFDNGCRAEEPVTRAIAGHAFCIAAMVENRGRTGALSPEVTFSRVGEGFSAPSLEDRFPDNVFPSQQVHVITSSPWQAQQRLGEEPWPFQVSVTSDSPMATFENKTVDLEVRVDRYDLVLVDAPDALTLVPGERAEVEVTLRNRGSAPATPTVRIVEGPATLQVQAPEGTTILPGEEDRLPIQFSASRGLSADTPLPGIVVSTVEDGRVAVPWGVDVRIADVGAVGVGVLPDRGGPGEMKLEVVLDNQESSRSTQWRVVDVGEPLVLQDANWSQQTDAFEKRVVSLPVVVGAHASPVQWNTSLGFEVTQDEATWLEQASVLLDVAEDADVDAWVGGGSVGGVVGEPVSVPLVVENLGNVAIDVRLESEVENGELGEALLERGDLAPGGVYNVSVMVLSGNRSDPDLGRTQVMWRSVDGDAEWREGPELDWSVEYERARLRIVETTLSGIDLEVGGSVVVDVVAENRGDVPVEAELVSVVGNTVRGYTETILPPGELVHESVSLSVPEDAEDETAWVILRPQGSLLGPADALLYEVGDAVDASLSTEADGGGSGNEGLQATPLPNLFVLLAVGLGSLLASKARREV